MFWFLLMFLLIYGCMHWLFLLRIRVLIPSGWLAYSLVIAITVFFMLSLFIGRTLEHKGLDGLALIITKIGYIWMGFLLISMTPCVIVTLYNIIVSMGSKYLTAQSLPLLPPKPTAIGILVFSLGTSAYGLYEASVIKVETLTITTHKLPVNTDKLKIVHISDVHLGLPSKEKDVIKIIDQIQALQPDILVCTGDMIDGRRRHTEELALLFSNLKPRLGKYAIIGNHEYYRGADKSELLLRNAGFEVLRGQSSYPGGKVALVGVDDETVGTSSKLPKNFTIDNSLFTILLKHRPDVDDDLPFRVDLQLSGHSHGGQIFPFTIPVSMVYPYSRGYHELEGGGAIYTNRGTGVWGPPMRVFSPPEITVIELVKPYHKN